ncbi:hypothetical protein ACHAWC_000907, partial [Mediolabrus comicus]
QRSIGTNHLRVSSSHAFKPVKRSRSNHVISIPHAPSSATALKSAAVSAPAATPARQFNYKKRVATFMAFMTGWADYLLVTKYKFFATMMTGNSMWMMNALVDARFRDVAFYASVIASYIFGVGLFRRAELTYKEKALRGLFAPIVTGCFLLSDYLTMLNPVGSEVTGTLIFVVTGAMTRVSNMMVDRISRTAGRKKISKEGMLMSLSVIGGFWMGAAWSVWLNKTMPDLIKHGVFSIIGLTYGCLFLWLDRDLLGAWWKRKDGKL